MVIQQCNADFFWIARIVSKLPYFLVLGYNKCLLLQCQWDMDAPTDNVPFSYEVEYDSVIHAYKSESYAGYQWPSGLSYFSVENAAELYISLLLGWGLSESILKSQVLQGGSLTIYMPPKKKQKKTPSLLTTSCCGFPLFLWMVGWLWKVGEILTSHLITPPVTHQMLKSGEMSRLYPPWN